MSHENKKKQLFDCLEAAEKKLTGSCLEQREEDYRNINQNTSRERDRSIEKYKRKDSIFKQPELPINKCLKARKRPDYEKNPQKYRHYSLADVTDTSDRMNSSAAFSFLREMEERKSNQRAIESSEPEKIVFKNSTKLRPKEEHNEDEQLQKNKIIGNKFVCKEYVVGEKREKVKSKKTTSSISTSSKSAKQLKLSHLDDDDDVQED
ncbi:hypothetical protein PVAND_002786 [Polypedilum vanderplanki]|uniref:U5 small nuclear ribonucleoprotein TSSC4 n=1 Tax=Polypedilum vanderplanki TaxID=319348 RepID=A0A9J6BT64_POLVA|nr:hypothetical protein PVAND_002786 [Polypedilum vanderplanki]